VNPHDITEILLKMALNTINQTKPDMLDSVTVCRFRTINNKLPIETGK
jgi:hypothetical protein